MPLFDVPGWSLAADPVAPTLKKRKRSKAHSDDKLYNAEINLERLMDSLKREEAPKRKRHKGKKHDVGQELKADQGHRSTGSTQGPLEKNKGKQDKDLPSHNKLKGKTKDDLHVLKHSRHDEPQSNIHSPASDLNGLTTFQHGMKQRLDGARFRWINEMLYQSNSYTAAKMMRGDPNMFHEYHTGFRNQVRAWPSNPADYYVSMLESYPARTVIVDLGCGNAALARALIPRGMIVHSYDLVSDGAYVIEADICDKLPLPGSEGTEGEIGDGEGHIVDIAVCALSLMGSNWPKCIREIWRILKPGGELKIAEVTSRLTSVEQFISFISSVGFRFKSQDESNTHFTLFEFQKVARKGKSEREWEKTMSKSGILKPCEYKRR